MREYVHLRLPDKQGMAYVHIRAINGLRPAPLDPVRQCIVSTTADPHLFVNDSAGNVSHAMADARMAYDELLAKEAEARGGDAMLDKAGRKKGGAG